MASTILTQIRCIPQGSQDRGLDWRTFSTRQDELHEAIALSDSSNRMISLTFRTQDRGGTPEYQKFCSSVDLR